MQFCSFLYNVFAISIINKEADFNTHSVEKLLNPHWDLQFTGVLVQDSMQNVTLHVHNALED